jgi:Flp pilus assembly protein TadD
LGYSLLSRALARQDHTEEARRQVRRLQVLAPRDPEILAGLGRLLVSQRRYASSVQLFRKALLMDPSRETGWFDLARVYWAMEAFEESEDTLARSCLIAPGLAVRAEVLRLSATPRDFRLPSVVRETASAPPYRHRCGPG